MEGLDVLLGHRQGRGQLIIDPCRGPFILADKQRFRGELRPIEPLCLLDDRGVPSAPDIIYDLPDDLLGRSFPLPQGWTAKESFELFLRQLPTVYDPH